MMEAGKGLWSLIQDQILGMKWLKDAVGAGLTAMGTDISSRLGGSVHFLSMISLRSRSYYAR